MDRLFFFIMRRGGVCMFRNLLCSFRQEQISLTFKVQGSVRRKYIRFDIFPARYNITQFIYFWKTALHVSGGDTTHHQEHI